MDDLKAMTAHEEIEASDDIHEYKTNEGYVIDAADAAYSHLKLARDVRYPFLMLSVNVIFTLPLVYKTFIAELRTTAP
jgi:hypothetical protein